MPDSPKGRDLLRDIVGTCAAQTAAVSLSVLSPLVLGALIISFAVGEAEAGGLITVELLVIGIVSIVLAPMVKRIPLHWLAITGVIIMATCNVLSSKVDNFAELYSLRIVAALGGAMAIATANAAIARARVPVLLYGISWAVVYCITAAVAIVMLQNELTYTSAYRWLAVVLVAILPLLWLLPQRSQDALAVMLPSGTTLIGCVLLAGMTLIGASMMAYYAFVERLADAIGASTAASGVIVAGVQVGGIIGGAIAAPVAGRFGIVRALVVAAVLHAAAIVIAVTTNDVVVLGLSTFGEAVIFILMIPLMLALAAEIDRAGRWAAAGGGTLVLSTAVGPLLGGMLIETIGYGVLGWLQIVAAVPALAMFLWVGRSISKRSAGA